MNRLYLPNYNLEKTLLGGQTFTWDKKGEAYIGVTQDRGIKLMRDGDHLLWQTYPEKDDFDFLQTYLRLDVDYENILERIAKDQHMKDAIRDYKGLRLLNQGFEFTLLNFLLSSNKNIPAIRQVVRKLAQSYGEKLIIDDEVYFLFPKTERLAELSEKDLRMTGMGFRARHMVDALDKIVNSKLVIEKGDDELVAREKLKTIFGVGDKIADCVLVFGMAFDNVTPLDIWGKRFLTELYGLDEKMKYEAMRAWISKYFEGYASWAGQFLFESYRDKNIRKVKEG